MLRRLTVWFTPLLGILLAAVACDDEGGTGGAGAGAGSQGGSTPGAGLPCDVADILQANCQSCHSDPPKFGAPMPLVDRGDLLAAPVGTAKGTVATVGEAILQRVSSTESPMPPPPSLPLGDADRSVLSAYVGSGMPESAESCGSGGNGQGGGYELPCTPDVLLKPPVAYEMPATSQDEYICFGVEAPSDIARHITAIAPVIDNETILHHILLLQAPNAVAAQGEPCNFVNVGWKLIYAWGPGTPPLVLPEEAGFPIGPSEPGHFVLQMHYNNLMGLSGEKDQTAMGLCTTDQLRPNDADVMAFGSTSFPDIPVNQQSTWACDATIPALVNQFFPVTIFQAWPHMHQIGRAMDTYITKAGGEVIPLANVPNYDFEYQITYPVDQAVLDVGDTLTTKCTWENTTGAPVGFGEGSQDEMCFNFVSYYPRITAAQWHWLLPSQQGVSACAWE